MALAHPLLHRDGDKAYRITRAEEGHGRRGGVTEAVGQQVEKAQKLAPVHRTEPRGEVVNAPIYHPAGQTVIQRVGTPARHARLRRPPRAGTHDHVVALRHGREQAGDVRRVVLTIAVHEHQHVACCGARAGFDRSPVALGVGVRNHGCTGTAGHRCGVVLGAIVDDNQLGIGVESAEAWQKRREPELLIPGGYYNGNSQLVSLQVKRECLLVYNRQCSSVLQRQQPLLEVVSLFYFTQCGTEMQLH